MFLSDTYHHLEKPERMLASIHRRSASEAGWSWSSSTAVPGVSTDFVLKHVRADKARFIAEITAAGFEPIKSPDPPRLKENFFAEFRRVERAGSTP